MIEPTSRKLRLSLRQLRSLEASWLLAQGSMKLRQIQKLTGVSVCTIWKQKWAGVWLRETKRICPTKVRWIEARKLIGNRTLKAMRARLD